MLSYDALKHLNYRDLASYLTDVNNYYQVVMKQHNVFISHRNTTSTYSSQGLKNSVGADVLHAVGTQAEMYALPAVITYARHLDGSKIKKDEILAYNQELQSVVSPTLALWTELKEYYICPLVPKYSKPVYIGNTPVIAGSDVEALYFVVIPSSNGYPDISKLKVWTLSAVCAVFNLNPLRVLFKEMRACGLKVGTARELNAEYVSTLTARGRYSSSKENIVKITALQQEISRENSPIAALKTALEQSKYDAKRVAALVHRIWTKGWDTSYSGYFVLKDDVRLRYKHDSKLVDFYVDFKLLKVYLTSLGILLREWTFKSKKELFAFAVYATYRCSTKTYANVDLNETGTSLIYDYINHNRDARDATVQTYVARLPQEAVVLHELLDSISQFRNRWYEYSGSFLSDSLYSSRTALTLARLNTSPVTSADLAGYDFDKAVTYALLFMAHLTSNRVSWSFTHILVKVNGNAAYSESSTSGYEKDLKITDSRARVLCLDAKYSRQGTTGVVISCSYSIKRDEGQLSGAFGLEMPNIFQPYVKYTGDYADIMNRNTILHSAQEFSAINKGTADFWESYLFKLGIISHILNGYLFMSVISLASILISDCKMNYNPDSVNTIPADQQMLYGIKVSQQGLFDYFR